MMSSDADARELDATDDLPTLRDQFHIPPAAGGLFRESAYLAGNSLGLQHRSIRPRLNDELDDWARLGVEGHLEAKRPWLSYHELLRAPAARLVGAAPAEVVMMNSLTVNLHLMMTSFYRPTSERFAIVIEDSTFPSDSYAVRSQVALHGYDPDSAVIRLRPRDGESALRTEDVVAFLEAEGSRVALVLLGGVNYLTGELPDIPAITAAGRAAGAVVGWDLAHAAGNVPLQLHDWDVDWAAWCTYKYLNAGPGAVAGCFVHARHLADRTLPKLAGWWGTRPATRFAVQPAHPRHGASARVARSVRCGRPAGPSRQEHAADQLPRIAAGRIRHPHPSRAGSSGGTTVGPRARRGRRVASTTRYARGNRGSPRTRCDSVGARASLLHIP